MLEGFSQRISYLESRIAKIPDPFILEYRPPGEDYKTLPVVLDDLHKRLNNLEDVLAGVECQQSLESETL